MIVRNKKTKKEYEISKDDYQKLVDKKIHRNYDILDDSDRKTKIQIPKVIEEYQANKAKDLRIGAEKTNKSTK